MTDPRDILRAAQREIQQADDLLEKAQRVLAHRLAQVVRQAQLRRERREQGLCVEGCGHPSERYYRCLSCRRLAAAKLKARRLQKSA